MARFVATKLMLIGPPQPRLPEMWGPAAGAQSQSTPGASALAAPRQIFVPFALFAQAARMTEQQGSWSGR